MNFWYIVSTCFYLGKIPIAPGTLASLVTLLIWPLIPLNYFNQIIILIILFIIGIISSKIIAKEMNKKDPSEIVIDEVVGMGISLFMLPNEIILYLFAFIILRYIGFPTPFK